MKYKIKKIGLGGSVAILTQSYSKLFGLMSTCFATLVVTLMLTSCSYNSGKHSFQTSDEAVTAYNARLSELRKEDRVTTQHLIAIVNDWRVLDDSVSSCIKRDTIARPHHSPMAEYRELRDSFHIELNRLASSKVRNYHDLVLLKEQTNIYADDTDLKQAANAAQPFFVSLDSLPIYNKGGKKAVMKRYRQFLATASNRPIASKEDLLQFIKTEHSYYRTFLQYLPELAGEDVADIRNKTEKCCVQILRAADNKVISHKDAMIYIAMRTNLRLIRNAQTAAADLQSGKVTNEETAQAYLLMLVQPFTVINDLSMAVLSEKDMADLYKLADSLPKDIDRLAKIAKLDKQRLSDMPMLLMKIYLTRLYSPQETQTDYAAEFLQRLPFFGATPVAETYGHA